MTKEEVAKMIDHTQLAATAGHKSIESLCSEAKEYHFCSVCVNPVNVPLAASLLKGSDVKVCTVIGFPLGADSSADKAAQTQDTIKSGADEVDMVIDIGACKDGRFDAVEADIASVVKAARACEKELNKKIIVKVILETCYLTDDEIVEASLCSKRAGADFVKTSTGFGTPKDNDGKALPNGATVHAVSLMRKTVGSDMGVKASGGIHNAEECKAMIEAGASRIGASSGVKILQGWN